MKLGTLKADNALGLYIIVILSVFIIAMFIDHFIGWLIFALTMLLGGMVTASYQMEEAKYRR